MKNKQFDFRYFQINKKLSFSKYEIFAFVQQSLLLTEENCNFKFIRYIQRYLNVKFVFLVKQS